MLAEFLAHVNMQRNVLESFVNVQVPMVIDSSKFQICLAGLECLQVHHSVCAQLARKALLHSKMSGAFV